MPIRRSLLYVSVVPDRVAHPFRYEVPTVQDAIERLLDVLNGSLTREACADWALEYILFENPQIYPEAPHPEPFNSLRLLMGIDSLTAPGEYLYGEVDLRAWLQDMRRLL